MFENPELRTKVKICGLTNLEDARFASGAMADYLGFIFYEKSPRFIDPAKAGAIINWIEGPQKVGVFVNQPLDDVNETAKQTGIDYVQLHGNESPEYCKLVDKPIIKVIHIEGNMSEEDIQLLIHSYDGLVEYILFDTKVGDQWGGTGKTFDWALLNDIETEIPIFLSGGLNVDNIRNAIETVHPYAVDVSSSLEEEPGLKDFDKIEAFMDEMRAIWEEEELR